MKYLLDTHVLLWFIFEPEKLHRRAAKVLKTFDESHCVSIASLWEIAVKAQLGKLNLSMPTRQFFKQYVVEPNITVLDISVDDLNAYALLPLHHRDPFDRLIISQAQVRGLQLVSADENFKHYDVEVL